MPFEFKRLALPDVILVTPRVFDDGRGSFMESYKRSDFSSQGIPANFVQDNFSQSDVNVLRGLHFQRGESAQGKLVNVVQGAIFDVAVDIRPGSDTFGHHVSITLSSSDSLIWVPPGFAHGFLALEKDTLVHYKCSDNEYTPESECTLAWDDPELGIEWPLVAGSVQQSEKDRYDAVTLSTFSNELKLQKDKS